MEVPGDGLGQDTPSVHEAVTKGKGDGRRRARLGRSGGGRGLGCVQSIGAMCSVFGRMCSVSGPMCSLFGRMCSVWRARCSVFGGTPWSEREHGRKARFPIRQAQDGVFGDAGMTGMCPPGQANVSSFWPDVSTFRPNVSSFRGNVSSFRPNVSTLAGQVRSGRVRGRGGVRQAQGRVSDGRRPGSPRTGGAGGAWVPTRGTPTEEAG